MLVRKGREQPLIPRYFDLLVFLIERRGEAVDRRDMFDRIWTDVIVSDRLAALQHWGIGGLADWWVCATKCDDGSKWM